MNPKHKPIIAVVSLHRPIYNYFNQTHGLIVGPNLDILGTHLFFTSAILFRLIMIEGGCFNHAQNKHVSHNALSHKNTYQSEICLIRDQTYHVSDLSSYGKSEE